MSLAACLRGAPCCWTYFVLEPTKGTQRAVAGARADWPLKASSLPGNYQPYPTLSLRWGPGREAEVQDKLSVTETQLRMALLAAIRLHPECAGISGVVIVPEGRFSGPSFWKCHWVRTGDRAVPAVADEIAREMQGQYLVRPDEA